MNKDDQNKINKCLKDMVDSMRIASPAFPVVESGPRGSVRARYGNVVHVRFAPTGIYTYCR